MFIRGDYTDGQREQELKYETEVYSYYGPDHKRHYRNTRKKINPYLTTDILDDVNSEELDLTTKGGVLNSNIEVCKMIYGELKQIYMYLFTNEEQSILVDIRTNKAWVDNSKVTYRKTDWWFQTFKDFCVAVSTAYGHRSFTLFTVDGNALLSVQGEVLPKKVRYYYINGGKQILILDNKYTVYDPSTKKIVERGKRPVVDSYVTDSNITLALGLTDEEQDNTRSWVKSVSNSKHEMYKSKILDSIDDDTDSGIVKEELTKVFVR